VSVLAHFPTRIAFRLSSSAESLSILEDRGAEQLSGPGRFISRSTNSAELKRIRGFSISNEEIKAFVDYLNAPAASVPHGNQSSQVTVEDEELVERCLAIIKQEKSASTSLIQRRLGLGYSGAAHVIDILERRGIIGPGDGAKPREILVPLE
jgi:DNA segregation ATPase FtsK/SpoIIIE, S-DNA-T family